MTENATATPTLLAPNLHNSKLQKTCSHGEEDGSQAKLLNQVATHLGQKIWFLIRICPKVVVLRHCAPMRLQQKKLMCNNDPEV